MKKPSVYVKSQGFTLIETMVVVSILGITLAVGAPSFRSFLGTMNARAAAADLVNDLIFARSEAIKRNASITIAPLSNNWSNGWNITANGVEVRRKNDMPNSVSISGIPTSIQIRPNGRINEDINSTNVNWSVTSSVSGSSARCVSVTLTGTATSKYGACS